MAHRWDDHESALLELLRCLNDMDYRFVTPTPKSHAAVVARDPHREAHTIVDVLGWSRLFRPGSVDTAIEELLERGGVTESVGDLQRATIRVSSLGNKLFLHSAFPTTAPDSVFFGPDSYRFARFLTEQLTGLSARCLVDIGSGSGVGAIVAAASLRPTKVAMTDINPAALRLARINAAAAGLVPSMHCGDVLADVAGAIDIAIANPPYIVDAYRRAYRDGGALHGSELSQRITRAVLARLKPGGRFLLYTGSAIVEGRDRFLYFAEEAARAAGYLIDYQEIDPDVFGEELNQPAYADVDRIAVVGAVFERR